jgi:hypothetical protein
MANYHSPTVIQQMIPTADMTALEQLLLGEIFDAEFDGEAVYLCTDEGPRDMLYIDADKLREGVGDPLPPTPLRSVKLSANMAKRYWPTGRSRSTRRAVGGRISFRTSCTARPRLII